MKNKMSETCIQLLAGILVFCLLIMLIGGAISYVVTGNWISFVLGVFLGGIIACILARHMERSISSALMRDSDGAVRYTRMMTFIRFGIMIATLIFALTFPKIFNIIGVLLGILALKFSAYAQPLTSKYISTKKK